LAPLQRRLESQGWRVQPQAGWEQALLMLDKSGDKDTVPVLPATLDTQVESLLMLRAGNAPNEIFALRLWPAPARLSAPVDEPLWLGSAQTLHYQRHFNLIGMWRPMRGIDPSLNAVRQALDGLPQQVDTHPETEMPVLRVRMPPAE